MNYEDSLPAKEESPSVQNALSYMDLLYCQSMPFHPLVRSLQVAGMLAGLSIAGLFLGGSNLTSPFFLETVVLLFLFYLLLYPVTALFTHQAQKKKLEANITLTRERIKVRTPAGAESDLEWKNVSLIAKRHGAVILRISRKPDMYYWIPFNRFASAADAEHFFEKAKEYWENLRHSLSFDKEEQESDLPPNGRHVVANLTLKELIIVDYYLLKAQAFLGIGLCLFALMQIPQIELSTAIICTTSGLLMLFSPLIGARNKFKNHPEWMQARTTITPEFFESTTELGGTDNRLVWSSIKNIWIWNKNLMFKLENGRTVVIPMRCFSSESEAQDFSTLAKDYWLQDQMKRIQTKNPTKRIPDSNSR